MHLPDLTERAPHTWTEHTEMTRSIEAGDEDTAERQAREHVEAARRTYRERGHPLHHTIVETATKP